MGSAESSNKTMFQVAKHSTHEEDKDMLSGRNSPTPSQKSDSQGQQSKFAHFKGVVNGIRRKGGRRGLEPKTDLLSSSEHNSNESGLHFGVRVEGIDELISNTKFSRQELQRMYRGFKNECPNGTVDKDTFKKIYAQFFPYGDSSLYAIHVFNVFDQDRDGKVSFEDFVTGLSVSLYGSREEKIKWAFQLYDLDGDGCITREELATVVHSVHCMMGLDSLQSAGGELSVEEQVQRLFSLMDKNQDGVISEEEFLEGCEKDESIKQSLAMFDSVR
ncbi:neuronal calcium sensor 1-like isoform X1 [Acropora muricata]|uniref:Kv channel-interacting protein 1-like isoform X1 n=1 Tax=Acropora millepora TaxID=45264 RepID=UPI001CF22EB0|nr:Kv channel-interacting protein 1-like isoform X1 [Acropora millepora]